MLKIEIEQMDAIAAAMDGQRWRAAWASAQQDGLDAVLLSRAPEAELKAFAHRLGVFETEDLLRLLGLVARYGIGFPELPWAKPFFYRVPFDYPHWTVWHLYAQAREYEREQPGR